MDEPLILASSSPRRKALLRSEKIRFTVAPSRYREPSPGEQTPVQYARGLALAKAVRVAKQLKKGTVMGADTVVVLRRKILGKPRNFKAACRMLGELQGTTHRVVTAIALVRVATGLYRIGHMTSRVTMRRLTFAEVARYGKRHMDKAGAYAVQDRRDPVVTRVEGSFTNVVGLPMELVRKFLKQGVSDKG
jgi:septum formation protein